MTAFERRAFKRDYRACHADPELCAYLLAEAERRGQSTIDWDEYFRNVRLA